MLNYKAQDNTAQFSAITDERRASWNNLGESEITAIVSRFGTAEIRALSRAYDKNILITLCSSKSQTMMKLSPIYWETFDFEYSILI